MNADMRFYLGIGCVLLLMGAAIFLWDAFGRMRTRRLIAFLPTSKAKGVFIGLVELSGTAECERGAGMIAPMSGRPCVYVKTKIEERQVETYTTENSKGERVTKTRTVWKTLKEEERRTPFYLRDETGAVRVVPDGAEITAETLVDKTVGRSAPEYFEWAGGRSEGPNSCGTRRFTEIGIPLSSNVYVLGKSRVRKDAVAVEIAKDETEPTFLIVCGDEEKARKNENFSEKLALALALLCAVGFGACVPGLWDAERNAIKIGALAGGGVCVALWLLRSSLDYLNSFVDFRRRVDQAKANVDVELKRRADLLPALADATKGLARYEKDVQETLATLRRQEAILRVDEAQDGGASATAPRLLALVESVPELGADKAFAKLRQGVVDAEDRIALAREYYNNIAENYETRRQTFPHSLVAALWRLPEAKFFNAEGFEAKTVDVDLET
ncbi:MAG: LemA family protein [Thermoguttaceae bacterium]|nr:LemA family protein [Thermoguttaceae bacterium]MBQ7111035.1 LemA family protein [Thermoguttaceae bacterium]